MYKTKNMKMNIIARTLVGVVELAFSLFTFPYVARMLGPVPVGQVDFVTAAVSYFVILASFGIDQYGGRAVAQVRTESKKVDDLVSRLFGVRFALGVGLFFIYTFLVIPFQSQNSVLFYCSGLMILSSMFNLVWALEVLEDFSFLVIARLVSKLGYLIFLFLYVRTPDDVVKYFIGLIICDFSYYLFAVLRLRFTFNIKFQLKKMMSFLSRAEILGLGQIFFTVLVQSAITGIPSLVMGKMSLFHELGLLSTAQRFFWIGYYAIIPLSTVLQSRSMSFSTDDHSESRTQHLDRTANALFTFSLPIALGLILTATDLVPKLVGDQFVDSIFLLQILAPLIVLFTAYNFWGVQVVFSRKNDRALVTINLIGLVCMILFSMALIPFYHAKGAIIANIGTYIVMCVVSYAFGKKFYSMKAVMPDALRVILAGFIMCLALYKFEALTWFMLAVKIIAGAGLYFAVLILTKHSLIRKVLSSVKR